MRDIDVLGAGSLTGVKDFDTFLDVISLVRASRPDLTCRIAGDGPHRARLEAKADRLGLAGVVRFEGRISREQVLALMRRSRVLLHTSRFESYGLVFAEALSAGVRIVSRPVGIADSSTSWFVSDDSNEMTSAIGRFLNNPRPVAPVIYSIDQAAHAYAALYRKLCARERSALTAG
jgi:glycosyltransferase involved in cell wall biosynthesis